MQSLKNICFFITQYVKVIRKKWLTLLLLFVFPAILFAFITVTFVTIFIPSEKSPMTIGFIDEDKTDETALFTLLIESGEAIDTDFIEMKTMTFAEAEKAMNDNEISLYFSFPENFTEHLYAGERVVVPLVGNPAKPLDSFIIREMLDSLTRYIGTSQASILTINDYAKQLNVPPEERGDMLFDHFTEFVFFVLGKDQFLDEEMVTNIASESPTHYYLVAGWFIAFSIWLLGIYTMFEREEDETMHIRLTLFGVETWHQLIARYVVTMMTSILLSIILFIPLQHMLDVSLYPMDIIRIYMHLILYGFILLTLFSFWTIIMRGQKWRLSLQIVLCVIAILFSGAIVPTIYFPSYVQSLLPYTFSSESFTWLIDLMLRERNYTSYVQMIRFVTVHFVVIILVYMMKERMNRWVK